MLYVLFMKTSASPLLKQGLVGLTENHVKNDFRVVHCFEEEIPFSEIGGALEKVFLDMQSESFSPNGEKDELIKQLKVHGSNMTKGDLVFCDHLKRLFVMSKLGEFSEVSLMDLDDETKPLTGEELMTVVPIDRIPGAVATSQLYPPPPSPYQQMLNAIDSSEEW